jgi:diaminopimelate decarboxylase
VSGFRHHHGTLVCDQVPLAEVARATGTPVHVYSAALIADRYRALDRAFAGVSHRCHYAIKANATLGVVRLMRSLGAHADANSGGEIEVALRAGFSPDEIVFTGVGKTRDEIERAVGLGVHAINAESPGEVERIEAAAAARDVRARVAIRINPDVDAGSHPKISTGHRATKFGMSMDAAREMARDLLGRPHLDVVGLHVHVGSQITSCEPVALAVRMVAGLARELLSQGVRLQHLDVGGGLGIAYRPGQVVVPVEEYAAAVLAGIGDTGLTVVLEPGRWLVGPAGVLVTRVVDLKPRADGGRFVIVDSGMTDLIRPALYHAWHEIEPVTPRESRTSSADVVGPVCETSDTFGEDRPLPPIEVGDLLAIRDTGAYGAIMASNYNRRPMAAEVMVDGDQWRIIRRRQTIGDMLQWDQ